MYKKRIAIIAVLITLLLAYFWLGSRYPAIDEKAAMAGEVVLEDALSFEAHFPVEAGDPVWERIAYSTLNWVITNRQGMTFGVLLASLILTLLQLLPQKSTPRRTIRDILKGVLIGAPLGVCVNCAAPIAYSMRKQGVATETSLATMFASPSLNIIVLAMMFSILPPWLAMTKLAVTFIFLLLALPLLIRLGRGLSWAGSEVVPASSSPGDTSTAPAVQERWFEAGIGVAREFWRNLLFIVIRTVPLMFLAGLLGAAMATLLPLDSFAQWQISFAAMAGVALLGTFAPVPIAFDVVLVQALLAAGLPVQFAAVLLVTLGLFSIYPLLIVGKMTTARFSVLLFAAVSVFGIATGYFTGYYDDYRAARNLAIFDAQFEGRQNDAKVAMDEKKALPPADAARSIKAETGRLVPGVGGTAVQVQAFDFAAKSPASARGFSAHSGRSFGLAPLPGQFLDLMLPFSQGRGIASADFDGDGWPEIALAENRGIRLFRNLGGEGFEPIRLDFPELEDSSALLVAFVDIDNDGCLDLFAGMFGDNDYVIFSDCRGSVRPKLLSIPHEGGLMTQAAAFIDMDKDGDLDLLKGNWFFLIPRILPSERAANYLAENLGQGRFRQTALDEITGDTLTVLFSDFDNDGSSDMIIGNDYQEPDIFYRGAAGDGFKEISAGEVIPSSPLATMSIDTADIDNDLDFDMFMSGKINAFSSVQDRNEARTMTLQQRRGILIQRRKAFEREYCALLSETEDQQRCTTGYADKESFRLGTLSNCKLLPDRTQQDECMITIQVKNSLVRRDWSFCERIPAGEYPVHRQVCDAYAAYDAVAQQKDIGYQYRDLGAISQKSEGNVLLIQDSEGGFDERSAQMGVHDAYWAWSARFADLDHDEWQDLYVANGWWLETSMYSNSFFRNSEGTGFESVAEEFGLENNQKQCCFTYLDIDRDGDLDIVSRSLDGTANVYINALQDNHSVIFELRSPTKNQFGIGSKIKIEYGDGGGNRQIREIKMGGGFASFDAPFAHFGLGSHDMISRVEITWPDGRVDSFTGPLQADTKYRVTRQ